MKKLIGLMVALILALSVCACGGQPASEQKGESETAVKTESKEENKEDSTSSSAENSESSLDTESGRDVPDYSQEDCWLSFPEIKTSLPDSNLPACSCSSSRLFSV